MKKCKQKYPVGTQFRKRGKAEKTRCYTVVDFHRITNLKGDEISCTHIAEHEYMGQVLRGAVPQSTLDLYFTNKSNEGDGCWFIPKKKKK